MTPKEQRWRELCSQAIIQNDVNKLFNLFVELDREMLRDQRRNEVVGLPTSDLQQYPRE